MDCIRLKAQAEAFFWQEKNICMQNTNEEFQLLPLKIFDFAFILKTV